MKGVVTILVCLLPLISAFNVPAKRREKIKQLAPLNTREFEGSIIIDGREYYINATRYAVWSAAITYCRHLNMQVVSLETEEETTAVYDYLTANDMWFYWYWTSGRWVHAENLFRWTATGEDITYFRWDKFEPGDMNEECDGICMGKNGWWDESCGRVNAVMCEQL